MFHCAPRISTNSDASWHWCSWKTAGSAELWTRRCSFRSLCTKVGTSTTIAAINSHINEQVFRHKNSPKLPIPSNPQGGHWRANCSYAGLDPAATNQLCRWFWRGSKCPTKICSAVSCVMLWPGVATRRVDPGWNLPKKRGPFLCGFSLSPGCLGKSPWAELLELEAFEFANSGDSASARHTSEKFGIWLLGGR